MSIVLPTLIERFWAKVDKNGPIVLPELGPCWIWTAWKTDEGYGYFSVGRQKARAHRFIYEREISPIPIGYEVDHLCINPSCVRPDHLEAVTVQINHQRARQRYRGRTHCSRGHLYNEANTRIRLRNNRPARECRQCDLIRAARHREKVLLAVYP
jgi:hypothetical protein